MKDTSMDSDLLFGLLSRLTDEELPDEEGEAERYRQYNELQQQVNCELFDALEETSYPGKYHLFEEIRYLLRSVRLFSLIPGLIDRYVTGFYQPGKQTEQWLMKQFLDETVRSPFLSTVPTLLTHAEKGGAQRKALSVSEHRVGIREEEYQELLARDGRSSEGMNVSGVMHLLHIRSEKVPAGRAFLILPKHCSGRRQFDRVLFDLCDELVLFCGKGRTERAVREACNKRKETGLSALLEGSKVRRLLVDARAIPFGEEMPTSVSCGEFTAALVLFPSEEELASIVKSTAPQRHNCFHALWLETLFSRLLWHQSAERSAMIDRLNAVNQDMLSQDEELHATTKRLQEELREQLNQSDAQCQRCIDLCSELAEKLRALELLCGVEEGPMDWNDHALSPDGLLGHFFRMCAFYRCFQGKNAQNVRNLEALCKKAADVQLATIIANDYFQRPSAQNNLKHLGQYVSGDPFLDRLKIRHRSELKLSEEDCGALISSASFPPPLSSVERRMLGKYLLKTDNRDCAQRELYEAMVQGDREAGRIYCNSFCQADWNIQDAALYGVSDAALSVGRKNMEQWERAKHSDALFANTLKFLNIAAANRDSRGYAMLSSLWFQRGMQLGELTKSGKDCFRTSVHLLESSPPPNLMGPQEHERMGYAYFYLGEHHTAMEHLKQANTADSLFLQGRMYESGLGTAKNRRTACSRYLEAASNGHAEARSKYRRLTREMEEERKKKEASERESYEPFRTTSNYSTSSGW